MQFIPEFFRNFEVRFFKEFHHFQHLVHLHQSSPQMTLLL